MNIQDSVVIVSARRTAIGKFAGSLAGTSDVELASATIKDCHSFLPQGLKIDEVRLVNVQSGGLGQNPVHQVGQAAGIGSETSSFTARKVCGSGLKAVTLDA